MAGFKEHGQFIAANVPESVKEGGIYFDPKGKAEYSVRHPNFRLRCFDQQETISQVSQNDIDPIKLHPGKVEPEKVPHFTQMSYGIEAEFTVLDTNGNPVDLYGGGIITKNGNLPHIVSAGENWLIDELGGSPEGLRFQLEIATHPGCSWKEMEENTLARLTTLYKNCKSRNLLLLPTGLWGGHLEKDWANIPPHPYIGSIHSAGLEESGLDFDTHTVQTHTGLASFASIEFALYAGNIYNGLLATLTHGLSTSAPFDKGIVTAMYSNREASRNALSTKGGVQAEMVVDGKEFLRRGDVLVRAGKIPVPERAFGSHSDTRAAKLTTGTFETGPSDMSPNVDHWIALTIINRQFLIKVSEHLKYGIPLPSFLCNSDFETRVQNRKQTSLYGNRATLITQSGIMTFNEAWQCFFEWADPKNPEDRDWYRAVDVIQNMLICPAPASEKKQKAIECYLTPGSSGYLKGNPAEIIKAYMKSINGNDQQRIRATNLEMARHFMNNIGYRVRQG